MQRGKSSPIELEACVKAVFAWVGIFAYSSSNSCNSSWSCFCSSWGFCLQAAVPWLVIATSTFCCTRTCQPCICVQMQVGMRHSHLPKPSSSSELLFGAGPEVDFLVSPEFKPPHFFLPYYFSRQWISDKATNPLHRDRLRFPSTSWSEILWCDQSRPTEFHVTLGSASNHATAGEWLWLPPTK